MKISVVIPTYNTELLIERAVMSVLNQKGDFELEIIIVDDCSTDNTLEVIYNLNDDRIKIFKQEYNQGPAAARNRGIKESAGEYLAFLDGDDYWHDSFVQKLLTPLRDNEDLIFSFCQQCHKSLGKDDSIRPRGQVDFGRDAIFLESLFPFWNKYNYPICTGSVLMRRKSVLDIGGQREDLFVCEDLEFWVLLACKGTCCFIPEVLFVSDGIIVSKKIGWLEKNKRRWHNAPTPEIWEQRIAGSISEKYTKDYNIIFGEIASILQYCLIMSKRTGLALKNQKKYYKYFPKNKVTKIYHISMHSKILWNIMCRLLFFREIIRNIQQ